MLVATDLNGCSNEFYIENVLEELDSPREWFFDSATRDLYYYHTGTEPIASLSKPTSNPQATRGCLRFHTLTCLSAAHPSNLPLLVMGDPF